MSTINYDALFTNLPSILNLPLNRKGRRWVLNTYMDLREHGRSDKLIFIRNKGGGINVIEQGGSCISLYKFLLEYSGSCKNEQEVMDLLTNGNFSLEIRNNDLIKYEKTKYVDNIYIDRLCLQEYNEEKPYLYYKNNNFYKYLCNIFDEQSVYNAFSIYRVGTIGNKCIFWKSDSKKRWLNDNRIEYLENGHRDKLKNAYRKFTNGDFFNGKGYFGYNLIKRDDIVCMVESEKTAIIMSIVEPTKKWIACSGLQMIHYCNKQWLLYPDYSPDAIDVWRRKGNIVEWWNDFKLVNHNDDIADCFINEIIIK